MLKSDTCLGAGVPLTSQQLYSAGTTDDLRQAMLFIRQQYPSAPLHGLGFSLGAGVMIKYIAEERRQTRLQSVCALGCVRESTLFKLLPQSHGGGNSLGTWRKITLGMYENIFMYLPKFSYPGYDIL